MPMAHSRSSATKGSSGIGPMVRPTRSQAEIDLLPPYGDPEVALAGELGTYLVVGAVAMSLYRKLRR